jgi:uncharacterized pyridoxamine 5'-phosphate oxidase family protein
MEQHPYVEICIMGKGATWLRLNGKAVFVDDATVKKEIFDMAANVRNIYKTPDNPTLVVFYLENARAVIAGLNGEPPQNFVL